MLPSRAMISGGALLVALLFQNPISAAGDVPQATVAKARLDLRSVAACVSRGDLVARVAGRSPRIQFVDDAAIIAQVVLTSTRPGNVVAELVLTAAGDDPAPRRIVARTCAEAADAIALIIAVTLDPTLTRKSATGSAQDRNAAGGETASRAGANVLGAASSTTTEAAPASNPAPAAKPSAKPSTRPSIAEQTASPATVESPGPAAPAPSPAAPTRRHFGAYVAGQTIFGPAPVVMPGVALYGMAALDRDGIWAPALFVGAMHVWRSDVSEPGGTASFALDGASVDACPLRLGWSRLVARPCASALVGRLTASGNDTDQAASAARPFATAGLALAASFGATVELSARLGVGVTLIRDSYEFGATTFHRAARVTTSASLGIGLHWP